MAENNNVSKVYETTKTKMKIRQINISFGMSTKEAIWSYLLALMIIVLNGCSRGLDESEMSDIDSPVPAFQASAMHKAAESGNYEYLSEQIELLANEDIAVRFYAILSLKKLTGTDNGYNYRFDAVRRREAINKWRKWLEEQKIVSESSE